MVQRCNHCRLENTSHTLNMTLCFRVTPSTPFVLIVLPLLPQGKELVIVCISLRYTCHGTVLSLSHRLTLFVLENRNHPFC
jgi:hypothetical protein